MRLDYVDGIRATAALYVALTHAYNYAGVNTNPDAPRWLKLASGWLGYGHYAVDVFIVISGFCLMFPVVASPGGDLRSGLGRYFKRRALRILPPYYAALFLTLGLIV